MVTFVISSTDGSIDTAGILTLTQLLIGGGLTLINHLVFSIEFRLHIV
jgi:hypothetical protein